MIKHVIGVLERDGRKKARSTALDLLQRLLDKRFLNLADAPTDERKVMASAIRAIWERMRGAVTWDPKAGRYADR